MNEQSLTTEESEMSKPKGVFKPCGTTDTAKRDIALPRKNSLLGLSLQKLLKKIKTLFVFD